MKLTEKHVELISRTAAQVAFQHFEQEKKLRDKKENDRRLRNVKLLLRNYRAFTVHCADVKLEINELNDQLDLDEFDTDEFAIRSVMKSKEMTLAMVKYINKTLEIYKIICNKSEDPEDKRRYQVIYEMYISDNKKTAKDIATGHSMHLRTIYKDINKACEALSVLMFGVNGIRLR